MKPHTDFLGMETYLRSLPPLILKGVDLSESLDKETFISRLLDYYTRETETFEKTEEGEFRVKSGFRRTLGDIYRLCLTYVDKNIRLEEAIVALFSLIKTGHVGSYICEEIDKRVWYSGTLVGASTAFQCGEVDEYGLDYSDYIKTFQVETRAIYGYGTNNCKIKNYVQWS